MTRGLRKDLAKQNIALIFVTLDTFYTTCILHMNAGHSDSDFFHLNLSLVVPRSVERLVEGACFIKHFSHMRHTLDTFHLLSGWLKDSAYSNC